MMAALGFIIGMCLGSFAKAASERMILNKSLLGRSYCQSCKNKLRSYDLFPVFSYILLHGRCRYCHKRIPIELFLTELVVGLIGAAAFFLLPAQNILGWADLFFVLFVVTILTIIFWVDLRTGLIPDRVTYPATAIALIYLIISSTAKSYLLYQGLQSSTLGRYLLPPYSNYFYDHLLRIWGAAGWTLAAAILSVLIFILLIVVTRGRGMGWGDVKYVLFLGLAVGYPSILIAIFFAFLIGAIFSIFLILFGKKHFGQTIPFGPFLSLGAVVALLYGPQIINWYINGFRM